VTDSIFPDRARIDAREKVCGTNIYAADVGLPGLLYAMMVPSVVAKGTMTALSTDAAMRVPGVVRILTPDDFPGKAVPVAYPNIPPPPSHSSWPRRWKRRSKVPRPSRPCSQPKPSPR
jgi:xanthine dehydrogenase YagR molybdenum-binding subunit